MVKKFFKATILLPLITLFCFAGFIGSLLVPNTVLDTYVINMTEEEGDAEVLLPLSFDNAIVYEMNTNGRSMNGIQIGINKNGMAYSEAILSYQVYLGEQLVSDNQYDLTSLDDLQYVYLPYQNYESCNGDIRIEFKMKSCSDTKLPAVVANHSIVKGIKTITADENQEEVSLKGNHIYTHDTYPFLYDFRILAFLFLAVSMTVSFPNLFVKKSDKSQGGNKNE